MNMLGNQETYNLNAKAGESHGLLRFVHWLLTKHLEELEALSDDCGRRASLLLASATAALDMETVLGITSRPLTRPNCQSLLNSFIRFMALYRRAGGVLKPKFHLLVHLIQRSLEKGNARLYLTYRDESFNAVVAKIARSAHRRTWFNVIHFKAHQVHRKTYEAYVS